VCRVCAVYAYRGGRSKRNEGTKRPARKGCMPGVCMRGQGHPAAWRRWVCAHTQHVDAAHAMACAISRARIGSTLQSTLLAAAGAPVPSHRVERCASDRQPWRSRQPRATPLRAHTALPSSCAAPRARPCLGTHQHAERRTGRTTTAVRRRPHARRGEALRPTGVALERATSRRWTLVGTRSDALVFAPRHPHRQPARRPRPRRVRDAGGGGVMRGHPSSSSPAAAPPPSRPSAGPSPSRSACKAG